MGRARTRARATWLPVLQCSLAAVLAWVVATDVVGHGRPFFAPIAAIVCLGTARGARLRRSLEMMVGVTVGIAVGDLLIAAIGTGAWQIGLVVLLAMSAAVLLDGGPVITLQAGSSAVLVATLLPPGQSGGPDRVVDALVGGAVALVVVALLPVDPLRVARRDAGRVLEVVGRAIADVGEGLATGDVELVSDALAAARGTQASLDVLRADLAASTEIARLAPLRWRHRGPTARLVRAAEHVDNAARNTRVLARRALVAVHDGEVVDPRLPEQLALLAAATRQLAAASAPPRSDDVDPATPEEVAATLRAVAGGLAADLGLSGGLSVRVVTAQVRSLVVDLLRVTGAGLDEALATLPPTAGD
ncbi:FUSC family protein [Rhodococcus aerolatus]